MTSPPVTIVGFSSTDKVPGYVGEVVYGAGAISASSIPLVCLLVGTKISAGSATANQDIVDIRTSDDADTYFGAGSELARMCYKALQVPGVILKAAPVAEAGGAAAATATITIGGTWSTTGTWSYRIDGRLYTGSVASTDTPTTVAASIVSAVNANTRAPVTAANVAGVVTLTRKSKGARGNQGALYQDTSGLPSGATSSIGTPSLTGGGVRFTSGSGTEDPTTLLGVLYAGQYDRIGIAQNDLSSITGSGKWRDSIDAKAGPLEGRPGFVVLASTDSLSNTTTLAQGINDPLFQVLWLVNAENHPSEMAAYFAALRCVTEQVDPCAAYDGAVMLGIAPQAFTTDWPQRSTLVSALNSGITPLSSNASGQAYVVRSITSKSLNGSNPDYRTLDTSDAVVPQYIRKDLGLYWSSQFQPANPRVADDPADGEKERPQGIATPKLWSQCVEKKLREYERGVNGSPPIIINVDTNKPSSGYDAVAKRIMSLVPVQPAPNQHQIGVSVRQQS